MIAAGGDAHGDGRLVEAAGHRRRHRIWQLAKRAEVVQDPEAPALGGERQVAVGEADVGDRDGRQVQLQVAPVFTAIE